MKAKDRKIAMTDVETSGDVFGVHEILEIGLVVFDPATFEIRGTYSQKVEPINIENAITRAIEYNGYNEKEWKNAVSLKEAMKVYSEKTQHCIFCSYNVAFDWGFINDAFRKTGVHDPMSTFENHDKLDMLSIAWEKGLKNEESFSLKSACNFFDIPPEPMPHNALNGAVTAYELFKKLENK